jgi:hypothetical protein
MISGFHITKTTKSKKETKLSSNRIFVVFQPFVAS